MNASDELITKIVAMRLDGKVRFWALYNEILHNDKHSVIRRRIEPILEQMSKSREETFEEFQGRRLEVLMDIIREKIQDERH